MYLLSIYLEKYSSYLMHLFLLTCVIVIRNIETKLLGQKTDMADTKELQKLAIYSVSTYCTYTSEQ